MKDADRIEREQDVSQLRRMALVLAQENQRLVERIIDLQRQLLTAQGKTAAQLEIELGKLQEELATKAGIGAHASEKRPSKDEDKDGASAKAKPQKGHGPRPQPQLEVKEQEWELDEPDKTCKSCGGNLDEWPGQFEESEEVDVIEREFVIRKHKRKKYRCKCGGCVETAPGPKRILPGGRYSNDFAIEAVVEKYVDHMPLERQVRKMAREGLTIDSQVLFDQAWALGCLLRPAYERLGRLQLARPLLFVDETGWPLFEGKGDTTRSSQWMLWTLTSDIGTYDEVLGGRSAAVAEPLLSKYTGTIMCDGYAVYETLQKRYPALKLIQCWAHVRRKFIECESSFPEETKAIIGLIAELYKIEARDKNAPREQRLSARQSESKEVLERIKQWVYATVPTPGSNLASAIQYMGNRWTRLTSFTDDPDLPLDNNPAERALRSPVVGRKNHYGSRSKRGIEVSAIFYSLLGSATLVGVDPRNYLRRAVEAGLVGEQIPLPHELVKPPETAATAADIAS